MTFLAPAFFWAFLSLIPLAAIYLLKVRPRRKPTTALFLWEKVFREKHSTKLLHRLRDVWSLLLMAVAFSAVVLALARPQRTDDARKDALILIDVSASMNAREGNGSRLDRAKQIAGDIVQALGGAQRAAIAAVGHDLVYLCHVTDNPRDLQDAIDAAAGSRHTLRTELLEAFGTDEKWSQAYRVILISDGCFDTARLPASVELLKVGQSRDNVGIVAADMQYLPGAGRSLGFYFQLASSHEKPVDVDLVVSRLDDAGEAQIHKLIPLNIKPGINKPQVYTLEDAEPGHWLARLDMDDVLADDNVAYLAATPPRPVPVAVESDDRFFFEHCVTAFSGSAGLLMLVEKDARVVVSQSVAPEARRAIIFQPEGESPWWVNLGEEISVAAPRVLEEDQPALRYVDVASMPFVGARKLEAPAGAQIWVASEAGVPLVYQSSQGGKTAVVVNMKPEEAQFYYSAWFPVLVHSATRYLAGREDTLAATYPPASKVAIPGSQPEGTTQVVGPSGAKGEIVGRSLPPFDELGFYRLKNESGRWLVACSLLSTGETMIDNRKAKDTSQPIRRGHAPSYWLTLLAVMALATESLLYHRRKVG